MMKKTIYLNLIIMTTLLNSALLAEEQDSEVYPFIKPTSVEVAPVISKPKTTHLDSDKDGVIDADDKCFNTKEGSIVDKDGCVVKKDKMTIQKIQDTDNDGVKDSDDKCLGTSNEFIVDAEGCPKLKKPKLHFVANSCTSLNSIQKQLEDLIIYLKEHKEDQIIIYGYTDSSGNSQKNKQLSQDRAVTIKNILIDNGIKSSRLTAIGMGESNPIADNSTKEGRALNRRIEFEILK